MTLFFTYWFSRHCKLGFLLVINNLPEHFRSSEYEIIYNVHRHTHHRDFDENWVTMEYMSYDDDVVVFPFSPLLGLRWRGVSRRFIPLNWKEISRKQHNKVNQSL